ncbi:MAG: aminotransferase class V-fold PLP-dependent enzyme [Acidobacteria bacterium]|nr:aminotransferase class V-fold PLP-dependent enzyme [Acidobacteriota bacterium]
MSLSALLREEFPVRERFAYLNHASTGPLPRRSARAMADFARDQMENGSTGYAAWIAEYDLFRQAAARLIGAEPGEIAITKNTSEGLSFVANGLDWRPGDVVVGVRGEFPANYFPWLRLERRGVQARWLELRDGAFDLDAIDRACQSARLLAVSFVQYLSGFRADLDALGEICRRRGCLLVVDAVQGLGAFPVDVARSGVDALAVSGHKWLLGPEGVGFLFLRRELMPQVEPVEMGWTNVTGFPAYSCEDDLRADAGRYECGTLNTIGCFGLRASLELFQEVGQPTLADRVGALAERTLEGATVRGYQLIRPWDHHSGSGIVTFRKDGVDSAAAVARMAEAKVSAAARHGWIRVSPHFYNEPEDVDRLLELLD